MPTYIDGIGASENIDSSGERISVAGMDISQLPIDGVFNYEHDQAKDAQGNSLTIKRPENTIGKVLFAKKIFSEQDCEDDRQLYFWQKCQTPYVYVMGELFDDYKESAKDVAGMFRYDFDRKGQNERNVMNFSIEGAKIDKKGIDIVKSIARKVTITVLPCNKAAIAEIVPAQTKQKDDLDGLFKTENTVEIELLKSEDLEKVFETMNKAAPHLTVAPAAPADSRGTHIGKTKSGKDVFSHSKMSHYASFGSQDHRDAANHHYNSVKPGGDIKMNQHHMAKMKLHMQASVSAERREQHQSAKATAYAKTNAAAAGQIKKALTAGSGNVAPGSLSGGAALAKQDLKKGDAKTPSALNNKLHPQRNDNGSGLGQKGVHQEYDERGQSLAGLAHTDPKERHHTKQMHRDNLATLKSMPKPNLTKSEFWFSRAQEEYNKWDKKDKFREFMHNRMPQLTKTEIDILGATLALKKSLEAESSLEDLTKSIKFGDGSHKDIKPAPKKEKHPDIPKHADEKMEVKGNFDAEVAHVEPHYSSDGPDKVYLSTGHVSNGHKKGKFKKGDKVSVRQHIQGTHIIEKK